MFAGHIGAGLAIAHAEPRVNVGVFITAALLLDLVLWVFVLLGVESASLPPHATTRQADFVFPYSHGLLSGLAWSAVAGAVWLMLARRSAAAGWRSAGLIAAAVFSHWLLDALVHQPQLPLVGEGSPKFGLGLSLGLPLALAIEALVVVTGLFLFLSDGRLPRGRAVALAVLALVALLFTAAGMTIAPPPPSAAAMAASSLATLAVVCGICGWLGRT